MFEIPDVAEPSRRLLRGGSIYALASVTSTIAGFVITPFLTRLLGLGEYDHVAIAVVVINALVNALALGLPTAIIRAVHAEPGGEQTARSVAITGFAAVVAVAGVAALVVSLAGVADIAWAVLAGGANGATAMVFSYFVGTSRPLTYLALSGASVLGGPGVGLVSALLFGPTAVHYLGGLAVTYLAVGLVGAGILIRRGARLANRRSMASALKIGLPIVPHQFAVGTAAGVAVLLCSVELAAGAAAHAQLALLVGSAPLAIVSALGFAWTPVILSASEESRAERLQTTARLVAWLAALGGTALAMVAPWIVEIVAPPAEFDVASMVPIVALSAFAAVVAVACTAQMQLIIVSGRTAPLAIASPAALAAGAIVGALTIPLVGVVGAGIAFAAFYAFLAVFTRAIARRASPLRWKEGGVVASVAFAAVVLPGAATLSWDSSWSIALRLSAALVLLVAALVIFVRRFFATDPVA